MLRTFFCVLLGILGLIIMFVAIGMIYSRSFAEMMIKFPPFSSYKRNNPKTVNLENITTRTVAFGSLASSGLGLVAIGLVIYFT